jgi:ribonuclease HII
MQFPDTSLEEKLWQEGYKIVVGIDEAGRGPLAGPVVAGACVIQSKDQVVPTVRDSKKMTEKQRNEAFDLIQEKSTAFGVGIVSAKDIDEIGIQKAVLKAMQIALEVVETKLDSKADYLIVDGMNVSLIPHYKMERIKAGDLYHYSIAAGSVLAKVTRDRLMVKYDEKFPKYGFVNHVGYGTKMHMEALQKYGPCRIHRRSFKPVAKLVYNPNQ